MLLLECGSSGEGDSSMSEYTFGADEQVATILAAPVDMRTAILNELTTVEAAMTSSPPVEHMTANKILASIGNICIATRRPFSRLPQPLLEARGDASRVVEENRKRYIELPMDADAYRRTLELALTADKMTS
jgi:hypothetical protein